MKRETSNLIRLVLEDYVPPALKDSEFFRLVASFAFGRDLISRAATFRANAPFLTEREYIEFYSLWPRVHEETDNSTACLRRIISEIIGTSFCAVGCGSGYLLRAIRDSANILAVLWEWILRRPQPKKVLNSTALESSNCHLPIVSLIPFSARTRSSISSIIVRRSPSYAGSRAVA